MNFSIGKPRKMLFSSYFLLLLVAFCHHASALFVPNITSGAFDAAYTPAAAAAAAAASNAQQKAYVDVAQIRNAELKFFNNGTYLFEVEMPCGVLNNRVLAVEQQSRLKLVDPYRGSFKQREVLFNLLPAAAAVGAASTAMQLSRDLKQQQQQQQLHERLLIDGNLQNGSGGEAQKPVRFVEREQPLTPNVPVIPLISTKGRLMEDAAHSGQRCKCSCKDEESGQVMDNVRINVAFPKPQQKQNDLTVVTTSTAVPQPSIEELQKQHRRFVEVVQRQKRLAVNRQARVNTMCLYVEEGKWPSNQDGFIKSLAPSRQSQALAADAQLEQCQLHFAPKEQGKKSESFTIECRGTARCEQGTVEPICLGGGHSVSTFQVANGELVLSIVPQPYMT